MDKLYYNKCPFDALIKMNTVQFNRKYGYYVIL